MEGFGWADKVMRWLRVLVHLVATHVLMVVGTLAGGVVLGTLPALDAGGRLLARITEGEPSEHLWHDFWRAWRDGFRRANVIGAPLWGVAALLLLDTWVVSAATGSTRAALGIGLAVATAWFTVVVAHVAPVLRRYDDPPGATWRFLALAPALSPGTALGVVAVAVVWGLTVTVAPVLVPLVGVTVPLLASGWLVDVRLDRIDAAAAQDQPG